MLGLRHYDSFGPIGFGIHSPPGGVNFKPNFQGPSAAFESFDHLIGSPASIGTTRSNDVGPLYFGEREAIKLAFAMLSPTSTTETENSSPHNTLSQASPLIWNTISVPNTLAAGINSAKDFFVETAAINGSIDLDATNNSESDYYSFTGRRGEIITIELMSRR